MKPIFSLFLFFLLAACASEPAPPLPTETEVKAAMLAYIRCLDVAAQQIDDGVSDATSIGMAIVPICRPERHTMARLASRRYTENPAQQLLFEKSVERDALGYATNAVLQVRRQRNRNQSPP